jgi:uncharacterized protein
MQAAVKLNGKGAWRERAVTPRDISSVIAKVVAPCNLNCSYCYIYNHADRSYRERPARMGDDTWSSMLARMHEYCLARPGHTMSLVLHGGEPTLIGVERFEAMVAQARSVLGGYLRDCSMQTNGTLLDKQWAGIIAKLDVNVTVSLDGLPSTHDRFRVDHAGRGSYAATRRGLEHLRDAGIEPQVICVVQPGGDGRAVYRHFRELGIRWMNFLLPDVSHDSRASRYPGNGATPAADFLLPVFEEWWREDNPRVRVLVFWELISALLGGPPTSDCFGSPALGYVIVESDGEIETLDALRVCKHRLGSTGLTVQSNNFDDLESSSPWIFEATTRGLPVPAACRPCRYARVCAGGSLPHRYSEARGFDNPSVWCSDIQAILDRMSDAVENAR